jgi:hypothetical protein
LTVPVLLEIQLTKQQEAALDQLVDVGLFGSTIDEVAEYLLTRGLQDLWRDGMLVVPRPVQS